MRRKKEKSAPKPQLTEQEKIACKRLASIMVAAAREIVKKKLSEREKKNPWMKHPIFKC